MFVNMYKYMFESLVAAAAAFLFAIEAVMIYDFCAAGGIGALAAVYSTQLCRGDRI